MVDRTHDFLFEQTILLSNVRQQGALPEEWMSDIEPSILQVGSIMKKVNELKVTLRNDGELTPVGRQKRIDDVAQKAADQVQSLLGPRIADYEKRMGLVGAGMRPKHPTADARSELRAVEIRSALRQIDPLQRDIVIREAMRAGDLETFFAAADAPKLAGVIPQPVLDDLLAQWGAYHSPEESLKLQRLTTCRDTLRYALGRALSELHGLAPTAVSVQPVIMLDVAA